MFKIKEGDPPIGGLTAGIHTVFRGLKFEPDADIGQISADFEMGRFELDSKGRIKLWMGFINI